MHWTELFTCVQQKPEKQHLLHCAHFLIAGANKPGCELELALPAKLFACLQSSVCLFYLSVYLYIYRTLIYLCSGRLISGFSFIHYPAMTEVSAAIWYLYDFLSWYEKWWLMELYRANVHRGAVNALCNNKPNRRTYLGKMPIPVQCRTHSCEEITVQIFFWCKEA